MTTATETQRAYMAPFDKSTVETLTEMKGLLEEILETMDVMSDPKLLKEISEAEKEVKAGKVRRFRDFA